MEKAVQESTKIEIAVSKKHLPSGAVLLSDAGTLVDGFQDAVARIIQQQLGYQASGRLRKESQDLSTMVLVGIGEGSGVLECETLPINDESEIRDPVSVAAYELVSAIETYNRTKIWPTNLPASIRNRFGQAVAPVIDGSDGSNTITISVKENGSSLDCYIDSFVEEALQLPDEFPIHEQVEIVGEMYDINKRSKSFKLETGQGTVEVKFGEKNFAEVDRLRWDRIFVSGFPVDERCRSIENLTALRKAENSEEVGIVLPSAMREVERSQAVLYARQKSEEFRALSDGWDSYKATSPAKSTIDFALNFLQDATSMFAAYSLVLPTPFFAPTLNGGVQFEWEKSGRELELEITRPNDFCYLKVSDHSESEGMASRWEAMRLIRWVFTGENA